MKPHGSILQRPCVSPTPWKTSERRYRKGMLGLHEEIEDFGRWIAPTPAEQRMRQALMQRITQVIVQRFPEAVVDYFGSYRTGLYLPTSDIDIVLLGDRHHFPLNSVKEALLHAGIGSPESVKVLDRASVPIIKLTDKHTDVKIDVSFNMVSGLNTAELVQLFMKKYPCLSKLVLVLKQFLQQHGLNESFTGGIGSYALVLLTISFLQLHPQYQEIDEEVNLGVLLMEFFELYGCSFNYVETAIRIKDGGCHLPKDELWQDCQKTPVFSIEDPLQPGNDVGRTSYAAPQVKQAFEFAYYHLYAAVIESAMLPDEEICTAPAFSFLGRIIQTSDELNGYRTSINRDYAESPAMQSQSTDTNDAEVPDIGDLSTVTPLISHSDDDCSGSELAKISNIHHSDSSQIPFVDADFMSAQEIAQIANSNPRPRVAPKCLVRPSKSRYSEQSSSACSSKESIHPSPSEDMSEPQLLFGESPRLRKSLSESSQKSGSTAPQNPESRKHGGWDGSDEQHHRYRTRYYGNSHRNRNYNFYLNDLERYPRKSASEIIREFEQREKDREAGSQTMPEKTIENV